MCINFARNSINHHLLIKDRKANDLIKVKAIISDVPLILVLKTSEKHFVFFTIR